MSRGSVAGPIEGKKGGRQAFPMRVAKGEEPGVYESLLFVSLGFLLMGVIFLVLELSKYEFRINP